MATSAGMMRVFPSAAAVVSSLVVGQIFATQVDQASLNQLAVVLLAAHVLLSVVVFSDRRLMRSTDR